MQKTKVSKQQRSMDQGSIQELLDTEEFVSSLKKNLGLEEKYYMSCQNCGSELEVEMKDAERVYVCRNDNCIEHAMKEAVKRKRWKEKPDGLMNKHGVNMFIATIQGAVDRNQITSNFQAEEIVSVMRTLHENMAFELYQNWSEYGIKNGSQARKIMDIGTNAVWSVFKRSLDAKTLDAISDMGTDKKVSHVGSEENKSKLSKLGLG